MMDQEQFSHSIILFLSFSPFPEPPSCSSGPPSQWHSRPPGTERWPSTSSHELSLLLRCASRVPGRNESRIQQQRPPRRPVCSPWWTDRSSAGRHFLQRGLIRLKTYGLNLTAAVIIHIFRFFSAAHCVFPAAVGDFFDPFGMGASSGVGSSVSSSRQASGPDLIGDLLGSDSSGTSEFPTAHTNPTPASNASLFDLSKHNFHCGITESLTTLLLCLIFLLSANVC